MELKEIEFSDLHAQVTALEKAAQDPVVRKRAERATSAVVILTFFGGFIVGMPLTILICMWLGLTSFVALLALSTAFVIGPLAYVITRYSDQDAWRLRTAGPQSRAFFAANDGRRTRLLEASRGYNGTLDGLRALPSGDPDETAGLVESMAQRRATLMEEGAAYLREFEAATAADRARFAKAPAKKAKRVDPRKQELRDFKRKVEQLASLEAALDRLQSVADAGATVDLSPYVVAQRFRSDLETKREALVARGLKPKKLPSPRVLPRKALPSTT